jgi:hypothetical protein
MGGTNATERGNRDGDGSVVLRVAPRNAAPATPPSSFLSIFIRVISISLVTLTLASHFYVLYVTRNESFKEVWLVRANIVVLVIVYGSVVFGFLVRSARNQLPPSCFSLQYVKFRWPIWIVAFFALASIPVLYFAQRNADSSLFTVLKSQIEYCLITTIIFVVSDSLSRYLYNKQLQQNENQRPVSPAPQPASTQYGYFSPKAKKAPPTLTSQKSPFDYGKFHYAR